IEVDSLFRTAVHREMKFELTDSEIIFGAEFSENFLNISRVLVSSRLCELDDRLTILGRFHRILFQARVLLLVRVDELDAESRIAVDRDFRRNVAFACRLQRDRLSVAENQLAAGKRLTAMDKHIDNCPF